ncbi:MAG TPA: tRNA (N(6)-L-threonylcarbamoyladenosine(37)-C(2))-methylthiotransferase MtaB [Xanthobacteraceae bacterium]|nr:tRNA (N(6)-L-threonylcarbamoyladenosine(37)-C(2))-methylthiotransferase MtaB [Xanthobacteraceae bacterium]
MSIDVVTFGCRLNAAESDVMRRHVEAAGFDDMIVINSCAVTAEAVAQARQTIRRLKRTRPAARIVVTGCAAETEAQMFAAMPEVDRVLGNGHKMAAQSWTGVRQSFDFGVGADEKIKIGGLGMMRETALHLDDGFAARPRAFVQVQNGCDHRCTFCIIPYGRGPSRSVPAGEVVAHVRRLAARDIGEVVLTGVDLTAWGHDLPGQPRLGVLVRAILRHVPELKRLRLSSIDPAEIDADLFAAIGEEARLMPHLHLSLQAGDDLILKRMKRRHSRADAIRFCDEVRRLRPDVVFGADLIAGFPTESDAAFRNTLSLVDDCDLTFLHVFPFSARERTPAARMPKVRGETVKERAGRLREKGEIALRRHLASEIGRRRRVLVEGANGRTEHYARVRLARAAAPGAILDLRIVGHDGHRLLAA